jgi:hypothetical protein
MSHIMKSVAVFAPVLFWMILSPMGAAASNQDAADVREVIAGLMRAWNAHDMHASVSTSIKEPGLRLVQSTSSADVMIEPPLTRCH